MNPVVGVNLHRGCGLTPDAAGFSGVCREGERLVVGPTDDGRFLRLKVGSIQRNRSACRVLRAGQAATLALGSFDRSLLRKVRGHRRDRWPGCCCPCCDDVRFVVRWFCRGW